MEFPYCNHRAMRFAKKSISFLNSHTRLATIIQGSHHRIYYQTILRPHCLSVSRKFSYNLTSRQWDHRVLWPCHVSQLSGSDVYYDYQSLVAAACRYDIFQAPAHIPICHLQCAAAPPSNDDDVRQPADGGEKGGWQKDDVQRVKAPLNQFNSLIPFTFEYGMDVYLLTNVCMQSHFMWIDSKAHHNGELPT